MSYEIVEDPSVLEELEKRGRRASEIRDFLEQAEIGKWYQVPFHRGSVGRAAKTLGYKVKTAIVDNKTYVKVIERP